MELQLDKRKHETPILQTWGVSPPGVTEWMMQHVYHGKK